MAWLRASNSEPVGYFHSCDLCAAVQVVEVAPFLAGGETQGETGAKVAGTVEGRAVSRLQHQLKQFSVVEARVVNFRTLRDRALTVTNGAVKQVKRLEQGSNVGWRITVRPDGSGDVTVVLPITTDCDDAGPICVPSQPGCCEHAGRRIAIIRPQPHFR